MAVAEATAPERHADDHPTVVTPQLVLLDGFELYQEGRCVQLPFSAQRLLALLALAGRPTLRSYASAMLWPDTAEERANGCLRSALWRVRRLDHRLLEISATHLSLGRRVLVDVARMTRQVHRLLHRALDVGEDELYAITLAGELLPGWYEDWVIVERERLHQLRLHGLEAISERFMRLGNHGAAIEAAQQAVAVEPLRESSNRLLIMVHLSEGNAVEALRQYDTYRRLLLEELGLEPSKRLRGLLPCGDGAMMTR
jgi:DNA-binding SARP family transcriptional activator